MAAATFDFEMKRQMFFAAAICLLASSSLGAQDARGGITGKVADPQGAMIPNALVVLTNTETNTVTRTSTNATGYFEANLLNPGMYSVTVEAPGFKKSSQTHLELSVAARLNLAFELQVGTVAETVEVTAAAPLLDTTSASGGRVLDNRQVMQLPSQYMNPFVLTTLAAGMQWSGRPEWRQPFAVATTSQFNTMGNVGGNEYTMDGAPVTGTSRNVGFVPPADAVQEFKLETTTFDASYGHTSGATINVMSKAGTNTFHGSLYEQDWQQRWNATPHFTRLAWEDAVRRGKKSPNDPKQASGRSNNFGATLGGPVLLPKVYNGRDKLFFFFSYNGIYQKQAETAGTNVTVPKMAWRQGDFSDLLPISATKFTIYDPRSARREGSRVVRTPFPGNKGIPVLNPMYKFYEPLYPKPNDVPGLVSAEGLNNYYASGMPHDASYDALLSRVDFNISPRHRLNARWYWNDKIGNTNDWTYEIKSGLNLDTNAKRNIGGGANYLWILSNTTTLDIGASITRYSTGNTNSVVTGYRPSDAGLPAYLNQKAGDNHAIPALAFGTVKSFGTAYPAISSAGTTGELKLSLMSVAGRHSLKYGWQERRYWSTRQGPGYSSGRFTFNNSYMRATDATTTASNLGLEWAAFMMGVPSGMSIDTNDSAFWSTPFRALYFQDDMRVTSRLRLNFGLRYEHESGSSERFSRGLSGEFLYDAKLPFTDLAQAAYARNPLPELPASAFRVLGGTNYLGTRSNTFTDGTHHWLPRLGTVYKVDRNTVIRAGYGWYYDTFNVLYASPSQYGYSQPTSTPVSVDYGATLCCGVGAVANLAANKNPLLDPFPVRSDGTRFDAPYGNRLGLIAQAGRGYTFRPRDFSPAWQQRWRIGVQRRLFADTVLEISYNGSRSRLPVNRRLDYLPSQYWATGNTRNQAADDNLNQNVPNPFYIGNLSALQSSDPFTYGYLSKLSFFTSKNIRKQQLLRAFPQMSGLYGIPPGETFADSRGLNTYRDLQVQLERRFARGFQTALAYTRAFSQMQYYENEFDAQFSWRPTSDVRPHRVVWSAIWELPFGRRRKWLQGGPMQHIVGGWQLSWIYQYQSGPASSWGNRFFYGDLGHVSALFKHDDVHSKDVHAWFDPSISFRGSGTIPAGFQGFEGRAALQPGSYQVRVFPAFLESLRADGIRNWDVKVLRNFRMTERLHTSISVDLLNATNHTNFASPVTDPTNANFGRVTSQLGMGRVIQFNLRADF
ncbi:MAG: TonB-dependent receptor [Acidobacteria bacterium]|nr:TonB-dependent receptor [Acidobacteriota bacterium]